MLNFFKQNWLRWRTVAFLLGTAPKILFCVFLCALLLGEIGCSSRKPFWSYVVERDIDKPLVSREKGEVDKAEMYSPQSVRVAYNDGSTVTEIWIPVLTSGQQILIDHKSKDSPSSLSLVPLPPSAADRTIEDAYVKSGKPVKTKAKPVSVVKSHQRIRQLVKSGNYELALEYAEVVLKRYPSHVKTLRTKGSLLLKMGEVDAAYKAYLKAQEIEPNRQVELQIKKIDAARDQ